MKKKSILFLFVILFVGWTYSTQFLQANSLPDTGITQCFNQSQMIACPQVGDPFYGQDAHYSINPHQFVKFDSDGNALTPSASEWTMVLDQATGLMWDVKKNNDSLVDRSRQVTWYSSDPDLTLPGEAGKYNNMENTEYYIKALNMTQFGGFSDWRLPDIMELKTIVKISSDYPATYTQYFPLSQDQAYWTSQTQASSVAKAWCVHFYDGHEETQEKGDLFYVRAVRSIYKDNKASHLFINNDNTVTDVNTGLMWQRKMTSAPQPWEYALENCENSTDAGYNDWRLPTLFELQSIVNYNRITPPLIDPTVFPNTPNTPFWTSTPSQQTGHIYQMNFNDGFSQLAEAQNEHYYRSVRGGQAMSSELLSIQSPSQGRAYTIGSTLTITWASAGSGDYVRIEISRQAGQLDTFEMITDSTENDGQYEWEVLLPASVNCVIRIIPLQQTDRQNSVGLFSIVDTQAPFISNIPATSTLIDQASHSIEYTINDTDGGPLMVIAESSNQDLIPLENIYLGYNSPYYVAVFESQYFYDPQYLTITPATGKSGTATITLTVYDCGFLSQQSSFQISVGDMRNALIHLFEQTEGDQWYDKSGWKTPPLSSDGFGMPQSECKWEGITCDSYGQVIHIELDTNNLTGPIPADIGNLKSLVKLNFSNNQLSGEIPANLSLLSSLQELRLDHNVLTGSVPGQIFQLSNLQILQLNHNQLSGNLDGTISQMQSLLSLNISHNQLTGGFPQSILSLYNLQHVDISQNYLTGLIPQGLSGMSYLQVLNISGNQFSGNLPSDIINLSMLSDHQSDFRYNQLTTQEQSLADFISLKQIDNDDWQSTQTLVPTNLNVLNTTDDIIHFKWIPVDYTIHDGGYEICCAKYVGGDYENCKIVNNKLTASYEMPGFKPETNYYCQIRSFTLPHTDNPNQLYSDFSSPLSATTQEEEIIWNTMESKSTNWLNGIWGTSSENVFVVGNDSTILHFDGADWLSMTSTTQQNLHHVYGLSETDIVAVGAEGTMLHYNGSNWENQQSLANIFLWALWGQDNIMYAVGNDGTILKRTNDIWEQESSNTNHDLKAIWGSSLNDIFVVGEQGTILHYTGTTWNQIDSYTNTNVDLRCVYGFSNNDVYAGGYQGTVLHYNGTKWSTVNIGDTNHIMDIWGSNEERVFAVGYQGSIFYYDGTIWTKMESGTTNPLRSIWGHSTSDVFTVGYDGTILRLGSSAPFISVITPQYTYVNIVKQIQFTIRSTMTPPDKLGLTARSTDSDLIPWDSEHLYFQGMSGTRYLFVKPAYDHYGETDIIVTVKSPNGLTATSQFHMTVHNQIIIPTEERQALEALYQSTNGHSWANKENWLGDLSTECTWYGVVCENNEHVIKISLPENELSGTITPDLGNIRYLRELDLHGNQLTGVLPKNLGDLTHLDVIDLRDNMLSGSLPDEWGRIQGLLHLKLNNNQLSGNIPSAIGSMQYLQSILFNSNKLSGIIPEQIKRLSYIKDGQSDFRYNALYTNDDSVKSFVDNIQQDRDWESTQTIAPYTICFNDVAAYSVSLSWNEISYSLNAGGYEVFYTDDPDCLSNHPENVVYRVTGPTSSKKDTTIVVTGLLPETTYYFKLRSLTAPHAYNANTVYSEFSDITFVTTKDPATLPLWKNGSFESKFVNWSYDNSFQVIESGQSIGSQWDQFFSIQAMEGNFVAVHANSGLSGTAQLSQELYIPAGGAELSFYYRLGWDLTSGNATQPRQFKMTIYPENSDNPLETHLIKEMYPNTKTKDTGEISESIDVSNYACQTIRMAFELYSPEQNSNLSFLLLDNVSLTAQYSKVLDIFLPDNVTEGDGILVNAGKIQLPKALQDDLAIHLISSTSSIIIPYQVIVPGGQKEAFFNIGISDDTVINGLRLVTISIDDAEWASCGQTMWLYDNDDAWQALDSGTQNHLYSVWGRSSNDIFAVGRSGEIIHFDGSIWESMKSNTQSDLHAIWGDENQLYAVGDDGTILSYENNNWIKIDTSSQTHLTGIWGADGTIFAAGQYGVLFQQINNDWIDQTQSNPSGNPVILGGNSQSIYMISQSEISKYTQGDWIPISVSTSASMTDIKSNESNHWVLVGEKGTILFKKDADWQTATSVTQENLNAASVIGNIFYAAGNSGTILRAENPDTWILMNSQSTINLNDIWAQSKNNAFAVGDNGIILRYSGPDIQGTHETDTYVPGELLTIENKISFPANVVSITLCVTIPDGWSYKSSDANARVILDPDNNPIFIWTSGLSSPIDFYYKLYVPKGAFDRHEITAKMTYILGNREQHEKEMLPSPLVVEEGSSKYELTIDLNPIGSGTVSGGSLNCTSVCSAQFNAGEDIKLSASADSHYDFKYWLDTDTQTILTNPTLSISLTQNKTYQVFFNENQPPCVPEIISPANYAILNDNYVKFELMPFDDPDENDLHILTEWRIHRVDRPNICTGIFSDNCIKAESYDLTQLHKYDLIFGMQYIWDVGYKDNGSETLVRSRLNRFSIGEPTTDTEIKIEPGMDHADYQMISIPLWIDNPSAPAALKNSLNSDYDTRYVKIGMFDPLNNQYSHYNSYMELLPGKAFWVLARSGMQFSIHGIRVSTSVDIDVPLSYSADHQNGWNMIASPTIKDYYWDLLIVVPYNSSGEMIDEYGNPISAHRLKTIGEWGQSNPFLENQLWRWEKGVYYESSKESSYYSKYVIHAYQGYWVNAKQSNVWLRFPVSAQVIVKRNQSTRSSAQWTESDGTSSPPEPMDGLSQTATDISKGCFISAVSSKNITSTIMMMVLFIFFMSCIGVYLQTHVLP